MGKYNVFRYLKNMNETSRKEGIQSEGSPRSTDEMETCVSETSQVERSWSYQITMNRGCWWKQKSWRTMQNARSTAGTTEPLTLDDKGPVHQTATAGEETSAWAAWLVHSVKQPSKQNEAKLAWGMSHLQLTDKAYTLITLLPKTSAWLPCQPLKSNHQVCHDGEDKW